MVVESGNHEGKKQNKKKQGRAGHIGEGQGAKGREWEYEITGVIFLWLLYDPMDVRLFSWWCYFLRNYVESFATC